MDLGLTGGEAAGASTYRVLARKYRPRDFSTLYGQEALVRTLTNALTSGRLAHAFMLTGVRGVGKTTTARILARALNCSQQGVTGPTPEPCGVCENCRAILADHHPDVLEMDAASHTGVDDIRELQKSVAYRPSLGRYKIFIIDEVHMLSNSAFNALLKTLEEPPDQVIFIFATTEIRKVPVTVLSRCQRFDLRRIDMTVLSTLFTSVIAQEGVEAEAEALALIARAADGSARDGLSILDQAISLSGSPLTAEAVQNMLGLADRAQILDLCTLILQGKVPEALALFDQLYLNGVAPIMALMDLVELVHWLTRAKVGAGHQDPGLGETLRTHGQELAEQLSIAHLSRAWQMLSQAVGEVKAADHPKEAVDMALIRLAYAANLPTPDEIAKKLQGASLNRPKADHAPPHAAARQPQPEPALVPASGRSATDANVKATRPLEPAERREIHDLKDIIAALEAERTMALAANLRAYARVVAISPGNLQLSWHEKLTRAQLTQLSDLLMKWTGQTWQVTLTSGQGAKTEAEREYEDRKAREAALLANPLVRAAQAAFPDAEVCEIHINSQVQ